MTVSPRLSAVLPGGVEDMLGGVEAVAGSVEGFLGVFARRLNFG